MRALYRGHGYGEEPAVPQEPELSAKVRVLVPFAAGLTFLILLVTLAFVTRS
jgi:hypothetical protein